MATGNEIKQKLKNIGIECSSVRVFSSGSMKGNFLAIVSYSHKLSNKDIAEILNENGFRTTTGTLFPVTGIYHTAFHGKA